MLYLIRYSALIFVVLYFFSGCGTSPLRQAINEFDANRPEQAADILDDVKNFPDRDKLLLFMEKGRLIHGTAGEASGPDAVYRVISWEEDGEFTVHQEEDFPESTIQASIESLLMEGCRLLDEGRS